MVKWNRALRELGEANPCLIIITGVNEVHMLISCFFPRIINQHRQQKPVVVDNHIIIREILNMTILFDHDVIDGANMARFISELSENIEKGAVL